MKDYKFNQETPVAKRIHENGYFVPTYHRINNKDLIRVAKAIKKVLSN